VDRIAKRTIRRWPDAGEASDWVAREEPLEIRVEGKALAITMRTPGDDLDLVAGFFFTEAVVDGLDDLTALRHVGPDGNLVDVVLAGGVEAHREALARAEREFYTTSSCGVCGKASIDKLHRLLPPLTTRVEPDPDVLRTLPGRLQAHQQAFARTGGLHGAALADFSGEIEVAREDVGRHNAVDKVLGWRLRQDAVPVDDRILVVSSRAGFEIVQKAFVARVPVVAVLGAPTDLAIDLAARAGIALVAFLTDERMNRYT
jgi:FdhD protein